MLALVVLAYAHAGEPLKFEEQPLVVPVPKPEVEIVIARQEILGRYNASVERGITDRIAEMEKEHQRAEADAR